MTSGAGSSFPGRSSPKHYRLFSGITGLYPLAASRPLSLDGKNQNSLQMMPIISKLLPLTLITVLAKTTVITCITNDIKKDLWVFLCTYVNEAHVQIEWFIYQRFNYQSLKIFNNLISPEKQQTFNIKEVCFKAYISDFKSSIQLFKNLLCLTQRQNITSTQLFNDEGIFRGNCFLPSPSVWRFPTYKHVYVWFLSLPCPSPLPESCFSDSILLLFKNATQISLPPGNLPWSSQTA